MHVCLSNENNACIFMLKQLKAGILSANTPLLIMKAWMRGYNHDNDNKDQLHTFTEEISTHDDRKLEL